MDVWWKIDHIKDERKIRKTILGMKQGTSNNHVYLELSRLDIVSKGRKQKFYTK